MTTGRRAKVGLILCTFALCGAAALTQRWRHARRAQTTPHELYEVVLAQIRSAIADLLLLTGMDALEATDALPPVRR